jgi:hypothetical protein
MATVTLRLTDAQVAEVKAKMKESEMPVRSEEMRKVLTGRHVDVNLLTVDEYWLVEKYIIKFD